MAGLPKKTPLCSGFTLVEIMIVILIMSLLLLIAVPSWISARTRSHIKVCISQLHQIQSAKQQWAMENKKNSGDSPPAQDDLVPTYLKKWEVCPTGGTYTIGTIDADPTCSIGGDHVLR